MSKQKSGPEQSEASERTRTPETEYGRGSFGAWLRGQREVRGVGLETIAQTSKINIRYLELLEEDRFDLLPASIFVRGFLREYARIVGLDADEVLNFYLSASVGGDLGGAAESAARSTPTWPVGRTVAVLVGLAAAVALVVAAIVWLPALNRDAGEDVETMAPPLTEPAPELLAAEPAPRSALRVTLDFRGTSWVDVYADGERTVSELRVQGESLTVAAEEEVRLTLGSVDATAIEVNGEPFEHEAADDEEIVIFAPEGSPSS